MKKHTGRKLLCILFALVMCLSILSITPQTVSAASVKVTLVYGNEKLADADAYVITMFAEGYTAKEQKQFIKDVKRTTEKLLECSPWDDLKSVVKIYAVGTISKQSGCKGDHSSSYADANADTRDTYFSARYWYYENVERLLYITDYNALYEAQNRYKPETDVSVVLVNSDKYGGGGGSFSVISTNLTSTETMLHEMAHTIAGLKDEYAYIPYEAPNLTQESNPKKVKWSKFVGKNGIGISEYEGGGGWYVPSEDCKMKRLFVDFCEVCKQAIREAVIANCNAPVIYFQPYANDNNSYDGKMDFCKYLVINYKDKLISGDVVEKKIKLTYYDAEGNKLSAQPKASGTYSAYVEFSGAKGVPAFKQMMSFTIDHSYKLTSVTGTTYKAKCTDCGKKLTRKAETPKVTKLTGGKKLITLYATTTDSFANGVEVQYSKDKNFKKNVKTYTVKNHRGEKITIEELSAGKTYYVRTRTYHKTSKGTVYSAWSKVQSVKTK